MADSTIGDLPAAGIIDGSELLEIEQAGNSRRVSILQAASLLAGFRNKIINGDGAINQRGASSGISDDEYAHDRHYALTQSNDITVSTIDNPTDGIAHMMRLTQNNASAQRMGYAQAIESEITYGLRGKTVTLGGKLRYSNAAAVRYAVLEWTGTADSPTTDVVNDWTSGTYTGGNFFNSTTLTVTQVGSITPSAATITDWSMTATIGSSANNIIVMFWTEGTAAQNSTLDMRWYLVEGDATGEDDPFSPRHIGQELALCDRYYQPVFSGFYAYAAGSSQIAALGDFRTPMRTGPTGILLDTTPKIIGVDSGAQTGSSSAVYNVVANEYGFRFLHINGFSGLTTGEAVRINQNTPILAFDAEL